MSSILNRLPSPHDLLETPTIKSLLSRFNKSVVLDTARAALAEMAEEVKRSMTEPRLPSVSEISERISKRLQARPLTGTQRGINATGCILHGPCSNVPLPEAAMQAVLDCGSSLSHALPYSMREDAERLLCKRLGCEDGLLLTSPGAAFAAAMSGLHARRGLAMARSEMMQLGRAFDVPKLFNSLGIRAREIGAVNDVCELQDFATVASRISVLASVVKGKNEAFGGLGCHETEDLLKRAKESRTVAFADCSLCCQLDVFDWRQEQESVVKWCLQSGFNLVSAPGDTLLGAPFSGILLGTHDAVERVRNSPLGMASRLDEYRVAMVQATLALAEDPARSRELVPAVRMATTSLANLRHRAERLAEQIRPLPGIRGVTCADTVGQLVYGQKDPQLPDCEIVIEMDQADTVQSNLSRGAPAVHMLLEDGKLHVRMLGVLPEQDSQIATAFGSALTPSGNASS